MLRMPTADAGRERAGDGGELEGFAEQLLVEVADDHECKGLAQIASRRQWGSSTQELGGDPHHDFARRQTGEPERLDVVHPVASLHSIPPVHHPLASVPRRLRERERCSRLVHDDGREFDGQIEVVDEYSCSSRQARSIRVGQRHSQGRLTSRIVDGEVVDEGLIDGKRTSLEVEGRLKRRIAAVMRRQIPASCLVLCLLTIYNKVIVPALKPCSTIPV
mmetsp:Transcript_15413/g.35322  ORF Transcript_15413/g.35322 Transcript_15413/m.35322 type:complete len:219 (+) Transcript_15413:115-771(+)|eukprot:768203-Hanusia_phi.AAC.4